MINRLVPAGIALAFCAKKKPVPGEISRVKNIEEISREKLEKSPETDTFISSNHYDGKPDFINKQIPHNGRNEMSDKITKKGNA